MEELKTEATRHLIDQAVTVGRTYQSPQTGFIHYHKSCPNSTVHHTIPIYENALFILALFRTRLMDNIKEGQSLLAKLLHFQNKEGNFPVYLHEFPLCRDFSTGIQLLAPYSAAITNDTRKAIPILALGTAAGIGGIVPNLTSRTRNARISIPILSQRTNAGVCLSVPGLSIGASKALVAIPEGARRTSAR